MLWWRYFKKEETFRKAKRRKEENETSGICRVPPFVVKRTDAVEWIPSPLAAEWEGTGLFTVIPLAGENRSVFTSRLFWAARDERDPLNQWLRSLLLSYAHDHYPTE